MDTLASVASVLTALVLTIGGVYLSLYEPKKRHRWRHLVFFAVVGGISVVSTAYQSYRDGVTAQAILDGLDEMAGGTDAERRRQLELRSKLGVWRQSFLSVRDFAVARFNVPSDMNSVESLALQYRVNLRDAIVYADKTPELGAAFGSLMGHPPPKYYVPCPYEVEAGAEARNRSQLCVEAHARVLLLDDTIAGLKP